MAWTDEKREEVKAAYLAANPTAESSIDIVNKIAEDFQESPNGVRMILNKAEIYIKKDAKAAAAAASSKDDKPKRVSKADAIADLKSAIVDAGQEADDEILDKLTGKAAVYLAEVIRVIMAAETEE